ncbi:MAG TPA: FHA domain-containing protein [Gemmataceae bacterium]|nr:FHA domain-containing protein [Gemmataceae bacterium]
MRLRVRVRRPGSPPEEREFVLDSVRVGREAGAEVVIPDDVGDTVSWQHCRIDARPDGVFLHDLKSTNGTYLNGQRVEWPQRLHVGDQVQLGKSGPALEVLVVDAHAQPADGEARRLVEPPPLPPRTRGARVRRAVSIWIGKRYRLWLTSTGVCLLVVLVYAFVFGLAFWKEERRLAQVEVEAGVIYEQFADLDTDAGLVRANAAEVEASTRQMYARLASLDDQVRGLSEHEPTKGDMIYQRTVASTVWVLTDQGQGTGAIVEYNRRRFVVTAYHVVHGAREIGAVLPKFLNGRLLAAEGQYMTPDGVPPSARRDVVPCTVWASAPVQDVAILESKGLPPDVPALQFASVPPDAGADIHSVGGHLPGSRGMWLYSRGTVRDVVGPISFRVDPELSAFARVIETRSPTAAGDGGPVVNNRCELVGIASAARDGLNSVARLVEVGHVRGVIDVRPRKGSSSGNRKSSRPADSPTRTTSTGQSHVHALLLIDDADDSLRPWLQHDREMITDLIRQGLPAGRLTLTTLAGPEVTGARAREYFRSLGSSVTPADTVLCYFAGRGGMVGPTHFLTFGTGGRREDLSRHEVLSQMRATGARLSVLITNCYTTHPAAPPKPSEGQPSTANPGFLVPLLTSHKGVVNWQSSSPGQFASPGVFTASFCEACAGGKHTDWPHLFADVKQKMEEQPIPTPMTPHMFSPESAVRPN